LSCASEASFGQRSLNAECLNSGKRPVFQKDQRRRQIVVVRTTGYPLLPWRVAVHGTNLLA
jgi:hypothetical protein